MPMESDSESSEVEKQRSYSEPDCADQESEDDDHSTQPGPSTEFCRLGKMVYCLLGYGMILATMMMVESLVSSVLSRNHWVWQEIRFSGSTVSCVVCEYRPTVLFRKMPFHENIYARNVHLNFFL